MKRHTVLFVLFSLAATPALAADPSPATKNASKPSPGAWRAAHNARLGQRQQRNTTAFQTAKSAAARFEILFRQGKIFELATKQLGLQSDSLTLEPNKVTDRTGRSMEFFGSANALLLTLREPTAGGSYTTSYDILDGTLLSMTTSHSRGTRTLINRLEGPSRGDTNSPTRSRTLLYRGEGFQIQYENDDLGGRTAMIQTGGEAFERAGRYQRIVIESPTQAPGLRERHDADYSGLPRQLLLDKWLAQGLLLPSGSKVELKPFDSLGLQRFLAKPAASNTQATQK
ncbi:MAG: hypothetical protein H6707_02550 [Deltaproteobacteria bacterium]|nr:hypothetical protein [Deltaproteobacteria bacterium]